MTSTDAARARLVVSFAACELSDLARAMVPIGEDEPGAVLGDAVQLLAAARRLLDAAVVAERAGGAGWGLVGEVTGLTAAEARERFPGGPATGWWYAHLVREPLEAAQDLDDWVLRHADGDDPGPAPVSGPLTRRPERDGGPP